MSDIRVKASDAEIGAMLDHVDEAMENGAAGFSTGLFYPTNAGADADEVTRIAERFAAHGGVYATHMRDEGDRVLDSLDETLTTAGRAEIQLVISHHKCAGPANWGRTKETLPVIEAASRRQKVALDCYPYSAGSTNLRADLVTDAFRIMITWSRAHPETTGRDLADIAAEWGVDLHEAARRLDPAGAIYFQMDEADVRRVLSFPLAMIGSDGLPHDDHPHPRLWGTFPRVIGRYARDLGLFPMETAIHKMTGLPARTFGLKDRGRLAPGFFADLVVFDPATIIDEATYDRPKQFSTGIERVFVNGTPSWEAGAPASAAPAVWWEGRAACSALPSPGGRGWPSASAEGRKRGHSEVCLAGSIRNFVVAPKACEAHKRRSRRLYGVSCGPSGSTAE